MKRAEIITGSVLLLLFLVVFYQSTKLDMVYRNSPGAGFFPYWLSLIAAAMSLIIVVNAIRRPASQDKPIRWPDGPGLRRIVFTGGALVIHAYLVTIVGFILSTTGLVLFVSRLLGSYRWYQLVAVSLGTSVGLYVVFQIWLRMALPTGALIIP